MPYTAQGYARRAAECARLASLTDDDMLQQELLRMRQSYLRLAEKLGMPLHDAIAICGSAKSKTPSPRQPGQTSEDS